MKPDELATMAIDWTAEELDQAIKELAKLRACKEPLVSMVFHYGGPYDTTDGPRWNTQREALEGKSLIHFRHPGFGWLHFAMPPDEARKLAGHLLKQADAANNLNLRSKNRKGCDPCIQDSLLKSAVRKATISSTAAGLDMSHHRGRWRANQWLISLQIKHSTSTTSTLTGMNGTSLIWSF